MFLSLLASVITLFDDDILAIMILIFLLKLSTLLFFSINTFLFSSFFIFLLLFHSTHFFGMQLSIQTSHSSALYASVDFKRIKFLDLVRNM